MRYCIVTDGKRYEAVECPEGVDPDAVLREKYEGWIAIGNATSQLEAASLIENEKGRHTTESY